MLLIGQDLKLGEKEAEEIHIISKKYGLKFNFETDDGQIDDIVIKNVASGSKEKVRFYFSGSRMIK